MTAEEKLSELVGNPRDLPEWQSLVLGESTESQFISLLDGILQDDYSEMQRQDTGAYEIYLWRNSATGARIDAYFNRGVLTTIRLNGVNISVSDMVELLGPPEQYSVKMSYAERTFVTVMLVFEEYDIEADAGLVAGEIDRHATETCQIDISDLILEDMWVAAQGEIYDVLTEHWPRPTPPHWRPWIGPDEIVIEGCVADR